ncbi:MAG: tetratricopeptide repeat protein [Deltaproteobacteria bacterium]|nr:tetratricopeptide repeat protein [Deltaproteobacteria bacterium]MBW1925031.1 tetratricopeptide repeat protein [Deltaproteobacteria bacterium]MBW1949133.1 tetratricopeptide repeat protein [Deltaproteobacteria bacterium]MBW2008648.1 tetratricopeptide repeat protein [Deltaproteobacteria bacterium]MBW2348893.1 tetratricopeptide repeat protein [Deltaproteobacteria bacterium]
MNRFLSCIPLALICLFLVFAAPYSLAQEKPREAEAAPLSKSPAARQVDKKAREKLAKMSPELVRELDNKLAQALTLLYDREYARALPIFRAISEMVETMDIMFWYGTCAYKAGDSELAVRKFRQMLEIDPGLHRVRLELATAYFQAGKYEDSRAELETVLKASPPEAVKRNIRKMLAAIAEKTKKIFANVRISQGIHRDTNVSAGPDEDVIGPPAGGRLILSKTQKELDDWVTVSNAAANVLFDPGEHKGFMWNTTGTYYQTHNFDYHKFDFLHYRVTTGPWWVASRSILKLPVGYAKNYYEHDRLFHAYDFSPSLEFFFTRNISLKGQFSYFDISYESSTRKGQNGANRVWEISPNFYFNRNRDIISLSLSDENHNARTRRYTYDAINAGISYYKKFPWDMEFFARYRYTERDYEAPAPLWVKDRKDKRHNVYAALSQNFMKNLFVSLYFNWIDNNSNTEIYEFDKTIYGLSMGVKF